LASASATPTDRDLADGDAAFSRQDWDAARSSYAAARRADRASPAPLVGLARVQIARTGVPLDYASAKGNRDVAQACAELAHTSKGAPSFGPGYVELGRCRLLLGDAPGALDALTRGARLLPDEPEAHSQLGVAYLATGHPAEAVAELEKAVELDPGSSARHGNLGTALFMVGRTKEAVAEYEARVRADDGDAKAHSDLGTALLATTDLERALSELRRAVALDPGRATFHSNLGYALQQTGKLDAAIAEYREALRLDATLVSAWINLGTVFARDPARRADARGALERARSLSPDDPRVKANLEELESLKNR
jgi:Flp pilus assembly protein TadD